MGWIGRNIYPSYCKIERRIFMAKVIGKVNLNSLNYNIASTAYATCGTAAGTAAKVAYIEGTEATDGFTVVTGITVHVRFANTNTAASPTLSVNGSPATAIMKYGTTKVGTTEATSWYAGSVVSFTYDGTYWIMNDRQKEDVDSNQKVKAGSVTFDASDTVNFVSGSDNLTVTGDSSADTITISLTGKLPSSMLPGSVDEIIEGYYYSSKFYKESTHTTEIPGESGKIYVDLATNKTYRWSGSAFVEISASLALGTNGDTAAPGNHKHKIPSHTHTLTGASYTPAGSVTVTPNTTTVNSITAVGSLPSLTITEATASKITSWKAGSVPTRSSFTYATGSFKSSETVLKGVQVTADPTITLTANDTEVEGSVAYVSGISVGNASLSGTTSFNTDAIKSVTLSPQSSNGTNTPKYVESISGSAPSLGGTTTFVTGYSSFSGGSGVLEAYDAATNGNKKVANGTRIPVVTSVTHTAASLTGTKTFVTGYNSFNGGSGSLASNDTTTGIKYVESISYTSAKSSGTAKAGSETHTHTVKVSGTTGANSGSAVSAVNASYANGVLTLTAVTAAPNGHTHSYGSSTALTTGAPSATTSFVTGVTAGSCTATTKYLHHTHTAASLGTASTGTVGISGGGVTPTTYYLHHTHTAASLGSASTGQVTISGGSYSASTKYMKADTVAATKASVGLTAGSVTATTKYLTASASGTAVGANGTAVVPTALNTATAYSITGVGSVPELVYENVTVGSASDWSAGTLPTKGSNTTVVTGIKSASFSGTPTTITPTIAGSGELTTGTPQ
jgi:hypothetical protein